MTLRALVLPFIFMPQICVATEIYCHDVNESGHRFEQAGDKATLTLVEDQLEGVVHLRCSADERSICTAIESYETIDAYWIVRLDLGTHVLFISSMSVDGAWRTGSLEHFQMVCTTSTN
jgi:hypothetical protein